MDAATLPVGGSFSIGDSSSGMYDQGLVFNEAMSTFTVSHDFTLHGDGGSVVYNGISSTDAATLSIGGNFTLGANSIVYTFGTKPFGVTGSFALGENSFFDDFGT